MTKPGQEADWSMDHLPQPQKSFSKYPVVRCMCAADGCNDDEGSNFRVQRLSAFGFTEEQFDRRSSSDAVPSLDVAAPFLQAWLWFGLLDRIFQVVGVEFDPEKFVAKKDGSVGGFRLCTVALHRYLWYWVAAESGVSDRDKKQHCRLINEQLDSAFDALQCYTVRDPGSSASKIQDQSTFGPFVNDNASNVLLAIAVLAESLDLAQESIYRDFDEGRGRAWDETLSTRISLLEAGWCIKELSWLTDQFTTAHVTLLLYLSRVDRHVFARDHRTCSLDLCVYETIDYATYRPIHTSTGCCCSDVAPRYDSWKLMDLLLCRGKISLITFARTDSLGFQLRVHSSCTGDSETTPYVAISHVWSDRLGNLQSNALPVCQLQRLQTQVNALYPSRHTDVPFWIDTICVPRDKTTRTLAIKSMRHVYEKADKVLVLDSSLLTIETPIAPEELLIRIKVAPWSTRLWTYHEAALASRIHFQLKDHAITGDGIERHYNSKDNEVAGTVKILHLLESGNNEEYIRALIRAMTLNENGQGFLDLRNEADKQTSSCSLRIDMQDVDVKVHENSLGTLDSDISSDKDSLGSLDIQDILESISDETDEEDSGDGNNSTAVRKQDELRAIKAATRASIARTKAMNAEIERLKAETAKAHELIAQSKAEAHVFTLKSERLKLNSLGGMSHRQIPSEGLKVEIPARWFAAAPQPNDKKLADHIRRITRNDTMPKYWLRAFDPIQDEGLVAYLNLRTAFKRLGLNMYIEPVPRGGQIREIISALRWRTTSWPGDEAVCFAIILGLDVEKVVQESNEGTGRMKVLAGMWQEVPRELAFCGLKRMKGDEKDGFGWMPQSFMGVGLLSSGESGVAGGEKSFRTQRGLHIEADGIVFDMTCRRPRDQSPAVQVDGSWYEIWVDAASEEDRSWDYVPDGLTTATIFEEDIRIRPFQRSIKGIVARLDEEIANVVYVTHLFCVRVTLADKPDADTFAVHQHVTKSKRHQKWCVG